MLNGVVVFIIRNVNPLRIAFNPLGELQLTPPRKSNSEVNSSS
uniref:Uncharacterized protein n=1 Tax=Anguilla anguilla TaxID=7936 RepID=A0A0E9TXC9_ANGAN